MINRIRALGRFVFGLRQFLQTPLTSQQCDRMLSEQLRNRTQSFLGLLAEGVFGNPYSPYRSLLARAGVELGDVVGYVEREGLEATLERLYREGVYITNDEFKCRRPIQRGALKLTVEPQDFDNPLLARHFETTTGGSRGKGTRTIFDFDHVTWEAARADLVDRCFRVQDRPVAMWYPSPPAGSGISAALRTAKLGRPAEKWFSTTPFRPSLSTAHYFGFAALAIYSSRLFGHSFPRPEYVPLTQCARITGWLATKKQQHRPAALRTYASAAVRICDAASSEGIDISGSFFRVAGEPYTEAKAKMITGSGCRAAPLYAMTEIGDVGVPCAEPAAVDEVHLLEDKLALIQKQIVVGKSAVSVGAFFFTTLQRNCPKIMLNVDSGDYGTVSERDCGCPANAAGLRLHLSQIRSYEKLTSEGMTFAGSRLIQLAEEILPSRFGGYPYDYQFVEEEADGLPTIQIRIHPRVGNIDEVAVIATIFEFMRSRGRGSRLMADHWDSAGTLRVVRAESYSTQAGKVLPLHILHGKTTS